jgi:hypothetical protein
MNFFFFIFYLLIKSKDIQVTLNFHAEKHGKSDLDQHFSVIGRYLKQASFLKKLVSADDVIECILSGQKFSNWRRKSKYFFQNCFVFIVSKFKGLTMRNIYFSLNNFRSTSKFFSTSCLGSWANLSAFLFE